MISPSLTGSYFLRPKHHFIYNKSPWHSSISLHQGDLFCFLLSPKFLLRPVLRHTLYLRKCLGFIPQKIKFIRSTSNRTAAMATQNPILSPAKQSVPNNVIHNVVHVTVPSLLL